MPRPSKLLYFRSSATPGATKISHGKQENWVSVKRAHTVHSSGGGGHGGSDYMERCRSLCCFITLVIDCNVALVLVRGRMG